VTKWRSGDSVPPVSEALKILGKTPFLIARYVQTIAIQAEILINIFMKLIHPSFAILTVFENSLKPTIKTTR
jgi:hypothetical protein